MTRTSHQATGASLSRTLIVLLVGSVLLAGQPRVMPPLLCHSLMVSPVRYMPLLPSSRFGRPNKIVLLSTPQSNNEDDATRSIESMSTTVSNVPTPTTRPPTTKEPEKSSYPIDLPSPLLLASSMILAIVGVGSGFDLANSTPRFGFGVTFSVATVSLTLCAGLFYASILKAQAETEADDKEYMKGK